MMSETHSSMKSVPQPTAPTYTAPKNSVSFSISYFKTSPGIIKLIQLAIGVICMACAAPAWTGGTHWFLFIVVTAFVTTTLWCFIYLLNLKNAITVPIDWLLTEFILTTLFAVLYVIASIVQISSSVTKPRPPKRLKPFYITAGELLNTGITTLLYLIAVIVQFCYIESDLERQRTKKIVAGVFGVFNFLAYLAGSFFLYRDWKDSHPNTSFGGNVVKRNP